MRVGGGHGKGSGFERKIAKEIVKAFRKEFKWVQQRDCWRSVLSGGHEMSAGDLRMTPEFQKLFPFAVECKFYKKIDWWKFLLMEKKPGKEWKWVRQACDGARKCKGLLPLLVMKSNHGPIIVCRPPKAGESGWWFELWSDFLKREVKLAKAWRSK